jgi:hypothetical protein
MNEIYAKNLAHFIQFIYHGFLHTKMYSIQMLLTNICFVCSSKL